MAKLQDRIDNDQASDDCLKNSFEEECFLSESEKDEESDDL